MRLRVLVTNEDPAHLHKTLGLLCFANFVYRFMHVSSDMAFKADKLSLFCLALHALLSVSSLVFKIPKKRIADGDRIWPEYRWHSIIFAYRSIACLLLYWFEARYNLPPLYPVNVAIVLATHAFADLASWSVGDSHSSSVQDLRAPAAVRFFFSFMQFQATATTLVGVRRFSTQFFYVWLIQCTAFLMTLRRKNVVPPLYPYMVYLAMLIATYFVHMREYTSAGSWLLVNIIGQSAAYLRLGRRVDKYAIWAGFGLVLHLYRDRLTLETGGEPRFPLAHVAAFVSTTCAVLAVGVRRHTGGQHTVASRALDAMAIAALGVALLRVAHGHGYALPL